MFFNILIFLSSSGGRGPSLVCLQKTKMEVVTSEIVKQCLGNKFEGFYHLRQSEHVGRVDCVGPSVVTVSNPHTTKNTLTALVQPLGATDQNMTQKRLRSCKS